LTVISGRCRDVIQSNDKLVGLDIVFLVLYAALSTVLDGSMICVLLMFHCFLRIMADFRSGRKGIRLSVIFSLGVALITFANFNFINKINAVGVKEYFIYSYIIRDKIPEGTMVWAIGNTFIFIGFNLFKNTSLPRVDILLTNRKALDNIFRFIVGVLLLGFSGTAINFGAITGGLQKILILLNLMGIMFYARLWAAEKSNTFRNYAIILAALQTMVALLTSYLRSDLIIPSLSLFGGYFIGKGSVKYIFSYRIIPLLLVTLVFSLLFNTLSRSRSNFISAFTQEQDAGPGYVDLSIQERAAQRGGALDRMSNIAQLSNIVQLVERNGYYEGKASLPLAYALIPRAIWPDKPSIELGAWFALEIGAATIAANTGRANNSINMTIPGELYLDFGWLGVMLGCILFGGILSAFWNASHFNDSSYNISGVLWGGYLIQFGIFGFGSDLQILVSFLSTYITFLVIKKISSSYEGIINRPAMARK